MAEQLNPQVEIGGVAYTSSVASCTINRGRRRVSDPVQGGSCSLRLTNQSGDFDPESWAGGNPYRAKVRVSADVSQSDSFTRSNSSSSMGGDWSAITGTWGITSNKGYLVTSGGALNIALTAATASTSYQRARVDWVRSSGECGIVLRYADANNYTWVQTISGSGVWNVYERLGGVSSYIGNSSLTAVNSGTAEVEVEGATIRLWIDGVLVATHTLTDSTGVGDRMGVVSDASWTGTSNTVDNWWQSPDEHYPLFTGMVESWEVGFEGPNMSWVDIRASDGIAQLSQIQLETWIATSGPNSNTNPPTFAAEPSGTRISNLFACKDILTSNYPFWHSGADRAPSDSTYFDLDTGLTTVQGKEVTGNLWSEIQALAATEASPFVGVSRSGKFTFQARYEGDNNAYLEFDNRAANVPPNGSRTPIYQIRFGVNWDEVGNTAKVYRDDPYNYLGGLPAEYSDSSSVGTYGMKPVVLQNTQFTVGQEIGSGDWDAKSLAVMLVHHWSTPQMIPFQVIVKPLAVEGLTNDTTVWTNVLGNMEVGNQAVVYFDHPGLNAVETSSEMIVNGIAHSISQGGREWTTTFTLGYGGTYVDVSDFHVIGTNDFNDGKYAAY